MSELAFDLQRFADEADDKHKARESLLPHLRMICNVANTPIFSGFISILENLKNGLEFNDKYASPLYDFIGAIYKSKFDLDDLVDEATLFASTVTIANSILDVCDRMAGNKFLEASEELGKIAGETLNICNTLLKIQSERVTKLKKPEEYDDLFIPIITATISYGLATLSTFEEEELTPEIQSDINKALVKLGGATLEALLTEILGDEAKKFTTPFGAADIGLSVLVGILEGFNKYSEQMEYYSDDGLPEDIAKKEAIIDAVSGGLHDAMSNYLRGVDDIAFNIGQALGEGCKWVKSLISGTSDSYEFSISDKTYAECIREVAKRNEYGSSSVADTIEIDAANSSLYAQDGDDRIYNVFPNVTLYGGHGDDSINLYEGAKDNSIFGGNGADYIYSEGTNGTLYGGKDDDFFLISGNKNVVFGEEGNDKFFVLGSSNSISGGSGDDIIILDGATKSVIDYTQGDGQDVIYGYNTSDVIKIKGEYSTAVSGRDVIIQVGKGGIIVKDAKDLKININTIELEEGESLPAEQGACITNPYDNAIILMPSFQGNNDVLRGTSGNDRIENTLDNIMIYGLDGDDTIINYGKGVTINAGGGNDHVENYGASVKINGGDDNDYIYNEAIRVTINGGDGKDTINNTGNNARIDGGNDMDSIINSGENTDINSGGGNDKIFNLASNVRATGYLDDNYINNTKNNVTLEGSDDNDYIFNSGSSVSINAGNGHNSVSIDGSADGYQTIEAGNGNDTVQVGERDETEEKRYYNRIYAGDGNNYVNNSNVELSTISAGSGNDTIITGGGERYYGWVNGILDYWYTSIVAGAGDNQISVNSGSMTYGKIYAGAGNDLVVIDSITGDGGANLISIGSGDDSVIADIWASTINVGAGNNYVSLSNGGNDIIAGSGNDYVTMTGGDNTTSLGSGNNTLISDGRETVEAKDDDDNITVKGGNINVGGGANNVSITYGGDTTINTGDGDDTINVADKAEGVTEGRYYHHINAGGGNNYINNSNVELSTISVGSGNDTIITGGGERYYGWVNGILDYWYTSIVAGAGDNQISVNSYMEYSRITAGNGNDHVSIADGGSNNIVSVGEGRNTIITDHYYDTSYNTYNTITAGTGSDVIYTSGKNSFINAGSGRNLISLGGSYYNTIVTGKGDDTITFGDDANNNVIIFGGGNDLVVNYHAGDTIKAAGTLTRSTVGADVILSDGTSKMTLKGATGKKINTATLSSNDNVYKILVADKTVGDTLMPDGSAAPTPTLKPVLFTQNTVSGVSIKTVDDADIIDNSGSNVTISALGGNDTIHNDGKGVIVDAGAGNDSINNRGSNVTICAGSGDDTINNLGGNDGYGDNVTIEGGTGNDSIFNSGKNVLFKYAEGEGNDTITGFNATSTLQIGDGKGSYSTQVSGLDVIVTAGTGSITLSGAAILDTVHINDAGTTSTVETVNPLDIIGTADDDSISNSLAGATIQALGGDDTIINTGANVLFKYRAGEGNDLIQGFRADSTLKIGNGKSTYSSVVSGSDILVTVKDETITLSGAASLSSVNIKGTYKNPLLIDGSAQADKVKSTLDGATIRTLGGNDTIRTYGDETSIDGGAGKDSIRNYGDSAKIYGDAGNDRIRNYGDAVTLTGGNGNDTLRNYGSDVLFTYAAGDGNDKIYGFNETSTLSISGGSYSTQASGNNVIVTVGTNKITLAGAAALDTINIDGQEYSKTIQTLTNSNASKVTVSTIYGIADATARTKAIKITGNLLANTILGGTGKDTLYGKDGNDYLSGGSGVDKLYGGTGNDTLIGGAGNDSLWGESGTDTFIYNSGDGKDTISSFDNDDMLQITGTFSAAVNSAGSVVFKVGSTKSAITLKNFTASTFNINGSTYAISGSKLVKK